MPTQLASRLLALAGACVALAVTARGPVGPAHASDFDFAWVGRIALEAEGLSSPDHKERRKAVASLGSYDIAITAPYLLRALRDTDQRVRYEAGRILGKHQVAEAVPIVIEWLEDPDSSIKQEAAEILGAMATDEAVGALIRSLGDVDHRVRQRAAVALGTIGTPQVLVPLIGRLDDDKFEVRLAAVEQLEKIGDRRAVIPLVGAFGDASLEVRKAAVRAVGRLGDAAAVPPLLRLLGDPAEDIRIAVVAALGRLRAVEATNVLIEQLDRGGSDAYLGEVAYALGRIAGQDAEQDTGQGPASTRPDTDIDTDIDTDTGTGAGAGDATDRAMRALVEGLARRALRAAAREALRNAGAVAVPALVAHLDGEIAGDPATAVLLLCDIGDHRATPALLDELERGRIDRGPVLAALERIGDPRALVPLLGLLQSPEAPLRLRAMEALQPIIDDLRAADVLIALLDDTDLEIRVLAAEYLGLMRSRRAVPRLLALLEPASDTPPRLRAVAVDALGEIADPRATVALVDVLAHGPAALHAAAASALIYIGDAGAVPALAALARDARAPARAHAVRALGGILRDRPRPEVRALLETLAADPALPLSLAAIEALSALGNAASVPVLAEQMRADVHRRRAAAAALGNLGDAAAVPALLAALQARSDRVSGDAAWALGKLADPRALDALARAARDRGWATAINATAALARYAPPAYAAVLAPLLHHRDRLVRVNAAMGLGRMESQRMREAPARPTEEKLVAALVHRLDADPSPLVRVAAARALSRIGAAREHLARVSEQEGGARAVRAAAAEALRGAFQPPARTDWRNFYFVDFDRDEVPVRQEPYFLAAADGLVTALYTDARGHAAEEQFPPGPYVLAPRSRTSQH